MTVAPYVVLADTTVTWEGEDTFVRKGTVTDLEPGSALWDAYGGSSNLEALPAVQAGDAADSDHAELGN